MTGLWESQMSFVTLIGELLHYEDHLTISFHLWLPFITQINSCRCDVDKLILRAIFSLRLWLPLMFISRRRYLLNCAQLNELVVCRQGSSSKTGDFLRLQFLPCFSLTFQILPQTDPW